MEVPLQRGVLFFEFAHNPRAPLAGEPLEAIEAILGSDHAVVQPEEVDNYAHVATPGPCPERELLAGEADEHLADLEVVAALLVGLDGAVAVELLRK